MRNSSNSSEPGARNTNLDSEWNQLNTFLYYPTELISNYNAKVKTKCMSLKQKEYKNIILITKYICSEFTMLFSITGKITGGRISIETNL